VAQRRAEAAVTWDVHADVMRSARQNSTVRTALCSLQRRRTPGTRCQRGPVQAAPNRTWSRRSSGTSCSRPS
jgi:hypothetical protein